jgi:serine/threonine-protein kinase RsbW
LGAERVTTLTLASRLEETDRVAAAVREACDCAGLDEEACADLELAAVEAANNIVVHGYAGGAEQTYTARIASGPDGVRLLFTDSGTSIPPEALAQTDMPDWDSEAGRGMAIIRACVDELDYHRADGANTLLLVKRRSL